MKSLAAIALGPNRPLELCHIDIMGPKETEVLINIKASGVCHTDAYTLSGQDAEGVFPSILGHEGAGIVVEVGDLVTSLKPGDHVIPLYIPECRSCKFCTSNKTNLCQAIRVTQGKGLMPDMTTRFSHHGNKIFHYMGTSTFSEYTVVPEIAVAKINPRAPLDKVCLLGCGITTGIGAVLNTAKVEESSTVAVFGLGGIGMSVIQGAVMARAERILAIDVNENKFALAKALGATDTINPAKIGRDMVEYIIDLTNGGVDYSFECVGNVDLMRTALECCHKGFGKSVIIGVAPAGKEISTRPFQLVTGRTWMGSAFGGVKGRSQLPDLVDQYLEGRINIDDMVTNTLPITSINDAFSAMHAGNTIRTVVTFDDKH